MKFSSIFLSLGMLFSLSTFAQSKSPVVKKFSYNSTFYGQDILTISLRKDGTALLEIPRFGSCEGSFWEVPSKNYAVFVFFGRNSINTIDCKTQNTFFDLMGKNLSDIKLNETQVGQAMLPNSPNTASLKRTL